MKRNTLFLRVLSVICACITAVCMCTTIVVADNDEIIEDTETTETSEKAESTKKTTNKDYTGFYNVFETMQDAVTDKNALGMVKVKKEGNSYSFEAIDHYTFIKDCPNVTLKAYDKLDEIKGTAFTVTDKEPSKAILYVAGFKSVGSKQQSTGILGVFGDDETVWFKDTNAEDGAEDDENGTDMHREMTGQVELNELDERTKDRLSEIKAELEQRKGLSSNSLAVSIVRIVKTTLGILLIVYAVALGIAYFIESIGVFDDTIRPFYLLTFKRSWAVGTSFQNIGTEIEATSKGGVTIVQVTARCLILIAGGVLLLTIDWFGVAYTIYHMVSGK